MYLLLVKARESVSAGMVGGAVRRRNAVGRGEVRLMSEGSDSDSDLRAMAATTVRATTRVKRLGKVTAMGRQVAQVGLEYKARIVEIWRSRSTSLYHSLLVKQAGASEFQGRRPVSSATAPTLSPVDALIGLEG